VVWPLGGRLRLYTYADADSRLRAQAYSFYTVNSQMGFDMRIVNSFPTDVVTRNLSRNGHARGVGLPSLRNGIRKNAWLPGHNATGSGVDFPSNPSSHRCGRVSGQPTTQRSRVMMALRIPRFFTETAINLSADESPIVQTNGKVEIVSRTRRRHGSSVSINRGDVVSRCGMLSGNSAGHRNYGQGV
jgi:hypothetical protein